MKYIPRHIEDVVKNTKNSFKCVLLTGARQVGKTKLLTTNFPEYKHVLFDDPFLEDSANESPETFMMLNPSPVFFDEVQRVKNLFRYIKLKTETSDKKGQYLLSGSQPLELMKQVSESLSGRAGIVELSGLSLREIEGATFKEPFLPTLEFVNSHSASAKAPSNIWNIIHRGSYPELQDETVDWNMFYSSYVKTYLERDVRELAAVQNLTTFRNFMVACAARTGQVLNCANIASELGITAKTVRAWISILETTGIVYLLEPYSASTLTRATKSPKLYFRDTGLASYLTRWLTADTLAFGAMSGAMFETFVVSEILKSYSNRGIDYRFCVSYYRGKDKKKVTKDGKISYEECEIDLIIEKDGVLYPIEIKQTASVSSDMTSAFLVLDRIPEKRRGQGAIVCNCSAPGALRDNILQIPIWYI